MRRLSSAFIPILAGAALTLAGAGAVSAQVGDTARAPAAIQLSGEYRQKIPVVAVRPFGGQGVGGGIVDSLATIIRRDLTYSNFFEPATYPASQGMGAPDYRSLTSLGIDYLVTGDVAATGTGYLLTLTLHDVVYTQVKGTWRYRVPALTSNEFRMAVHAFSDEIVRNVSGHAGVAATRIALTRQNKASVSGGTGSYDLLIIDSDGYNLRRLSGEKGQIYSPAWSPDGRKLAYAFNAGPTWQLIEHDLATRASRVVTSMGNLTTPRYSPDGRRIAFSGWPQNARSSEIFDYDIVNNCCLRTIASSPREDQSPSYSADGSQIAFASDRPGQLHVYIAPAAGGAATRLSPYVSSMRGYYFSPDWSPTGSDVVFSGHWNSRGVYQIMIADARRPGGAIRMLTSSGDNEDPSWAPDGRHIVFSSGVGDQQLSLYVIDAVTQKRRLLVGGGGKLRMSDWSPVLARAAEYVAR